jgi:general secretion pathway protein F
MNVSYTARSRDGKTLSGSLVASSKKEAIVQLRAKGLQPVLLSESKSKSSTSNQGGVQSFSKKDLVLFTEELSELLRAGLPLEPALASMAGRDDDGSMKHVASELRIHVTDGVPLHFALTKVSSRFDLLYCNLIAAGEAGGSLPSIVTQHAKYLKEQAELRSKLVFSMLYPGFLVTACIVVLLVFLFYLLPQIAGMMTSSMGKELPIGISLSLALGDFLKANWMFIAGFIVVMIIGIKIYFKSEENRAGWDKTQTSLPFYGRISQYGFYVQWLQTLANLLSNGVPLVQSLSLTNQTVENRYYRKELAKVSERVCDGLKLTSSMKKSGLFPASLVDLVAVGDQTGKMDQAVRRAADYYEKRLEIVLKSIMTLITPAILLGMAILVAVLCSTMMQAIFSAMEQMK